MNAKQRATWEELVRQCGSRFYGSINVASKTRSDAIIAASTLVELVMPKLAELLEYLAEGIDCLAPAEDGISTPKTDEARELAAEIREVLDDNRA